MTKTEMIREIKKQVKLFGHFEIQTCKENGRIVSVIMQLEVDDVPKNITLEQRPVQYGNNLSIVVKVDANRQCDHSSKRFFKTTGNYEYYICNDCHKSFRYKI